MNAAVLRRRVRILLVVFIVGLVLSGLTAFPLLWEVGGLHRLLHSPALQPLVPPELTNWIAYIFRGLSTMYRHYPFLAYGTDWLAFAHLVIATAFIGPLRDPVRNVWVVDFGIIACVLVFPLAFLMGPLRGIPVFWQLIDCAFGAGGLLLLLPARHMVSRLERLAATASS